MSDNLSSSSYAKCFDYEHQFRVLVMHLIMDHLSLEQIDRYFFVYELPERLKDHGRDRLRSELLAYINEQLLDKWRKMPSALQDVLETIGRPDLSTKVQELVESRPAATVCQETTPFSPQQEAARGKLQKQPPVQESMQQTLYIAEDQLQRDSADIDRSSTEGEAHRQSQPQAASSHNTPQSTRYRKSFKQYGELLENILEETSLSQDDEKHNLGTESQTLKRTSSTASEASFRSSGYYSNPRASVLRLSQVSTGESIAENDDDYQEEDVGLLEPIKQTHRDSTEDEGISTGIHHTSEFRVESGDSSGTESSSSASSPSRGDIAPVLNFVAEEHDDLPPVRRLRSNQMSTPSHMRRLPKRIDMYSDLSPEHSDMRRRSSSLPTTSRTSYVQAQNASVLMQGIDPQSPPSHSSSTSLDSDTTYGSQQSIASTTSGHDSKANSLNRPLNQKPVPVDSEVMFSGSMKIKIKNILKQIEKNDQSAITSGEFPCVKGHRSPRYEMRFFPSNFGKASSALYIDVAKSYLRKKFKSKQSIMIPAMNITVQLSYGGDASSEAGTCRSHVIKTETLETGMKTIDDGQGEASKSSRCMVASFPQLVSHAELGLTDAPLDGRSSLVIRIEMSVRSS